MHYYFSGLFSFVYGFSGISYFWKQSFFCHFGLVLLVPEKLHIHIHEVNLYLWFLSSPSLEEAGSENLYEGSHGQVLINLCQHIPAHTHTYNFTPLTKCYLLLFVFVLDIKNLLWYRKTAWFTLFNNFKWIIITNNIHTKDLSMLWIRKHWSIIKRWITVPIVA